MVQGERKSGGYINEKGIISSKTMKQSSRLGMYLCTPISDQQWNKTFYLTFLGEDYFEHCTSHYQY